MNYDDQTRNQCSSNSGGISGLIPNVLHFFHSNLPPVCMVVCPKNCLQIALVVPSNATAIIVAPHCIILLRKNLLQDTILVMHFKNIFKVKFSEFTDSFALA